MNVALLFDRQARRRPHAPALVSDDGAIPYGLLRDRSRRFARLLATRGVTPADRVAILLPNEPAFAVALLGTLWHGAAAAVLSPAWTPEDAARALALADARLLVTTQAGAAAIGAPPESTLVVDDGPAMGSLGAALDALAWENLPRPAVRGASDPATILFSSGTTGDPKGVVLTHGNLEFNALAKIRYCGITAADRLAMVVPMAHCFGQNVVLLGALLSGGSVRIYPRFHAERVAEGIARREVTMLLAAPTAFERLLALPGDGAALQGLRFALTAAAPLPEGLSRRWRDATGCALSQGYGLTECSPFATYDAEAPAEGRGVGRPIDGVEMRVAGADDAWLPAGECGELAIRGPNVMAGYWRRPDATARALRGGWLRTGDVGMMDERGEVHLVDRVDDVINVAGFKAWPSDVERVLRRHPSVLDAAAYASPDPMRGATVAAALVLRGGAPADLTDIARFAEARLATFQRPTRLHTVDALPRSASGKVLRRLLARDDHRLVHDNPANTERPATGLPAASG